MAGNNDDVNEITNVDNFDESAVMSNCETHSTPSASQDKIEVNLTDETMVTEDSGVQLTPTSSTLSLLTTLHSNTTFLISPLLLLVNPLL